MSVQHASSTSAVQVVASRERSIAHRRCTRACSIVQRTALRLTAGEAQVDGQVLSNTLRLQLEMTMDLNRSDSSVDRKQRL